MLTDATDADADIGRSIESPSPHDPDPSSSSSDPYRSPSFAYPAASGLTAFSDQENDEKKDKASSDRKQPSPEYEESPQAMQRLFNKLDVLRDGYITVDEVSTLMKSLHLYPNKKKVKEIIGEVDDDKDGKIGIQDFVKMRQNGIPTEMNILAEFKKYDVSPLHRGFITADSIRKVLTQEGCSAAVVELKIDEIMRSDTNFDGKVSFRDLFEFLTERVPDSWLAWIWENVERNVEDSILIEVMVENGFHEEIARELISRTRTEGRLEAERSYPDWARSYVYTLKS